ncbi:pyridoxamine 5'-phosphate oxidase family protein [Paenibacillus lentus]|uniref:Flavin-nucleotide-binding protein n=1 Tax=Paenibacillus lentus TaxID=1338368 RepID=A0A3S8RZK6_9BACL|nr:pyridoxamine 5'-phosphate oxidase family protein [Paenibacillus lentus]AZK48381.1 flavin-nucleotide-binding protein [Paenibacillus lentus]
MRRKEFAMNENEQEVESFLQEMTFGFLGTVGSDGMCRVTPLNFVYGNGYFYVHGSLAGEKMKHLKSNSNVSFTVAKEYAIIPSYFTHPQLACPASAYFKSVMVSGHVEIVNDLQEKADAFSMFMQKLQPEGGYAPIDPANTLYAGQLKAVALIRIVPAKISAKFKFGQNLKADTFENVVEALRKRGENLDDETVEQMQKYCPFHAGE